ncbi:unnamed protein product, partial [Symbiodinium sp. KB8]
AAIDELKNNLRESARRAEKAIDERLAEVSEGLQQLEAERQAVERAKRQLEEDQRRLLLAQTQFDAEQDEVDRMRQELDSLRSRGGLFGCCLQPTISNSHQESIKDEDPINGKALSTSGTMATRLPPDSDTVSAH